MQLMSKPARSAAAAFCLSVLSFVALMPTASAEPVLDAVRDIERKLDARVGFYMFDTQTEERITHAQDDRFPLNSTFKLLACGALLAQVDAGTSDLSDTIDARTVEVVTYSPAIEDAVTAGRYDVSLEDACRMMLSVSDNTAANIVLKEIGGPEGLTAFLRSIGDRHTRLDRWETALNEARPGDPRDTTTPRAIAQSLQKLLLGDILSPASRAMLRDWLSAHSVADALFRAALPPSWRIDDRTGAGGYGSRSIIAILYPPGRSPVVATLFITETAANFDRRNAAIAAVGTAIVEYVGGE